jgi:hypothetical protein
MVERLRLNRKAKSKSASVALAPEGFALFGEPQLLEGEKVEAYHELLARFRAAIKPADAIEDMFTAEVADLEWEVLRWRRLKTNLFRDVGLTALETFLDENFAVSEDGFSRTLTEILQENVPEDPSEDFARLALACARNETDAVDKVNEILENIDFDLDDVRKKAETYEHKKLVQGYARHEPEAIALVEAYFAEMGTSMDMLVVTGLVNRGKLSGFERMDWLNDIERIDRLATIAEGRRNASLREIDRRRAAVGQTLRRAAQEIEGEFKVIDSKPSKGEKAA